MKLIDQLGNSVSVRNRVALDLYDQAVTQLAFYRTDPLATIDEALTLDPNANVRLRALEALYPHAERATVRAGVLAALPREQNPLVLLELIDFVATAHEDDAAPFLERLSSDESTNTLVRDAARLALTQF